jgi:hypothetical protein
VARLLSPPAVASISGSIGGLTYKRSRWGTVVYQKPHRRPRNTLRPQAARRVFSFFADRWHNTLTPAQRDAWNRYAQLEVLPYETPRTTHMTGYNAYLQQSIPWFFHEPWWSDDPPPVAHTLPPPPWWPYFQDRTHIVVRYQYDPLVPRQAGWIELTTPFPQSALSPRFWVVENWHDFSPINYPRVYTITTPLHPGQDIYVRCRKLSTTARFSNPFYRRLTWP